MHTCDNCQRIVYPEYPAQPYCPFRKFNTWWDNGYIPDERCSVYVPPPLIVVGDFLRAFTQQLSVVGKMLLSIHRMLFYRAIVHHLATTGGQSAWNTGSSYIRFTDQFDNWERWLHSEIYKEDAPW